MSATLSPAPVCAAADIPVGLGRAFRVGGKLIAVFRSRSGKVFAVDGLCPHKSGPLADGMLIGEQVVCPLHAFRFDGTSGACDQESVCGIQAYATEVRDGTVFVTVPLS